MQKSQQRHSKRLFYSRLRDECFTPEIPFWLLAFSNASMFFVGSDDISAEAILEAAHAINKTLDAGRQELTIAQRFALDNIAQAHEMVEHPTTSGRPISPTNNVSPVKASQGSLARDAIVADLYRQRDQVEAVMLNYGPIGSANFQFGNQRIALAQSLFTLMPLPSLETPSQK